MSSNGKVKSTDSKIVVLGRASVGKSGEVYYYILVYISFTLLDMNIYGILIHFEKAKE